MNIGDRVTLHGPLDTGYYQVFNIWRPNWYHELTGTIIDEYPKWKEHGYYRWKVKIDDCRFKEDEYWFDDCDLILAGENKKEKE